MREVEGAMVERVFVETPGGPIDTGDA